MAVAFSVQARLARMADEVDTFRTQIVTRRAEEFRALKVILFPGVPDVWPSAHHGSSRCLRCWCPTRALLLYISIAQ